MLRAGSGKKVRTAMQKRWPSKSSSGIFFPEVIPSRRRISRCRLHVYMMPKEKPTHEVRIGPIKAAIWKNETQNGHRFNATFTRMYKDKEGGEWKFTDSFAREDLLILAKVADQCHTWIYTQTTEETESRRPMPARRDPRDSRDPRETRDLR